MLGRRISRDVQSRFEAHHRTNVDDLPPSPFEHMRCGLLGEIKRGKQMHLKLMPPDFVGKLLGRVTPPILRHC